MLLPTLINMEMWVCCSQQISFLHLRCECLLWFPTVTQEFQHGSSQRTPQGLLRPDRQSLGRKFWQLQERKTGDRWHPDQRNAQSWFSGRRDFCIIYTNHPASWPLLVFKARPVTSSLTGSKVRWIGWHSVMHAWSSAFPPLAIHCCFASWSGRWYTPVFYHSFTPAGSSAFPQPAGYLPDGRQSMPLSLSSTGVWLLTLPTASSRCSIGGDAASLAVLLLRCSPQSFVFGRMPAVPLLSCVRPQGGGRYSFSFPFISAHGECSQTLPSRHRGVIVSMGF